MVSPVEADVRRRLADQLKMLRGVASFHGIYSAAAYLDKAIEELK